MELNSYFASLPLFRDSQAPPPPLVRQQHSNYQPPCPTCSEAICQCHLNSKQIPSPPQQGQSQSLQNTPQLQHGQLPLSFDVQETGYPGLLDAMATIPPNTTQPVENMHSPHATNIEYHSQPNANEELSKITWQQETRVNGRRRPVSEFLRLQERAALGNPSGDNNAMHTAGLVNSCDINFHGFQENYQQQQQFDSALWNSILNDRQIMRETTQSQPNVQDCIQTLSYMQEYQDAANLPTEAALFANNGYSLFLRNINSVWFEGSASSGVQEPAKLVQNSIPLLDSSSIGSSSVINSPIPQYQTVECVVELTGDVAQVPIMPIDSHLGVPKEMHHEIQSGETATDSDADADSGMCSKTAMIRKRAPYKRRGFMKRNREPDKTSSTVTPHAQAELRKTLRGISSNPFPTVIMVADLCKRLELSNKQVRNWFALHRHRDMYTIEVDGVKEWKFRDDMI